MAWSTCLECKNTCVSYVSHSQHSFSYFCCSCSLSLELRSLNCVSSIHTCTSAWTSILSLFVSDGAVLLSTACTACHKSVAFHTQGTERYGSSNCFSRTVAAEHDFCKSRTACHELLSSQISWRHFLTAFPPACFPWLTLLAMSQSPYQKIALKYWDDGMHEVTKNEPVCNDNDDSIEIDDDNSENIIHKWTKDNPFSLTKSSLKANLYYAQLYLQVNRIDRMHELRMTCAILTSLLGKLACRIWSDCIKLTLWSKPIQTCKYEAIFKHAGQVSQKRSKQSF